MTTPGITGRCKQLTLVVMLLMCVILSWLAQADIYYPALREIASFLAYSVH